MVSRSAVSASFWRRQLVSRIVPAAPLDAVGLSDADIAARGAQRGPPFYTAAPRRFNRPRAALVSTIFGALARDENANRQPKNLEDRDLGTWKAARASFVSL